MYLWLPPNPEVPAYVIGIGSIKHSFLGFHSGQVGAHFKALPELVFMVPSNVIAIFYHFNLWEKALIATKTTIGNFFII